MKYTKFSMFTGLFFCFTELLDNHQTLEKKPDIFSLEHQVIHENLHSTFDEYYSSHEGCNTVEIQPNQKVRIALEPYSRQADIFLLLSKDQFYDDSDILIPNKKAPAPPYIIVKGKEVPTIFEFFLWSGISENYVIIYNYVDKRIVIDEFTRVHSRYDRDVDVFYIYSSNETKFVKIRTANGKENLLEIEGYSSRIRYERCEKFYIHTELHDYIIIENDEEKLSQIEEFKQKESHLLKSLFVTSLTAELEPHYDNYDYILCLPKNFNNFTIEVGKLYCISLRTENFKYISLSTYSFYDQEGNRIPDQSNEVMDLYIKGVESTKIFYFTYFHNNNPFIMIFNDFDSDIFLYSDLIKSETYYDIHFFYNHEDSDIFEVSATNAIEKFGSGTKIGQNYIQLFAPPKGKKSKSS